MDARSPRTARGQRLFFDVDGVLAPIVARPEDARVPAGDRAPSFAGWSTAIALVAVRQRAVPATTRATIVGVPELVYVGNHGLELDRRGSGMGRPAAAVPRRTRLARDGEQAA